MYLFSIFTDSKILFDYITKCSQTQERRLMIDLQAVCDAYAVHDISNVSFVRGPNDPAFHYLLQTGKCDFIENSGFFVPGMQPHKSAIYLLHLFATFVYVSQSLYTHFEIKTYSYTRTNQYASLQTFLVH